MREYLFRGKRVDNGEWVIGYYVQKQDPLLAGVTYHYILTQERDSCGCLTSTVSWYKVIPETVGQYTGLTDKNSQKIFEGDIVRFVNYIHDVYQEQIGICVFEQDECNFCLQYVRENSDDYPVSSSTMTIYLISNETYKDDCCYEIVGNIHDNPELLEDKNER